MRYLFARSFLLAALFITAAARAEQPDSLRIIVFGAHPDDCEIQVGGTAALWVQQGHKVKFVSVTNGDIGHWGQAGGALAQRRKAEVVEAAAILGVETEVFDIHDGEVLPTLENRKLVTKAIREWKADLVLAPRPNDYHPDHRYTGILVQDAAYMVTVPFFCPDVPHLKSNPVFMYYQDRFQKPNPFKPDVAVPIDEVIEKKLDALAVLVSQFAEGGANGGPELYPDDSPEKRAERQRVVRQNFSNRFRAQADRFREELADWVGADRAAQVRHAEAFEICEYGKQPDRSELARLFPFFKK